MFNKTSEQKQNYMQELDAWIDQNVFEPLYNVSGPNQPEDAFAETSELVRTAIKNKVLESYRNGLAAKVPKTRFSKRD